MAMTEAARLFPEAGGIVVGERYRVDRSAVTDQSFRADDAETWGAGGKSPLLCFDASFGSSHGIVFAGSGGTLYGSPEEIPTPETLHLVAFVRRSSRGICRE